MPAVIDAFLFFQELDLLEIRLAYLSPHVDRFVIVEACQTFSGKPKEFVFEKNAARFSSHLPKIEYVKITDFHSSFTSIKKHLAEAGTASHRKISSILENHTHYPKTELHWVLDSYHRECIHLALDRIAAPEDTVWISDLDEIPSIDVFGPACSASVREQPRVCQQHEFRYFLNYFKDAEWPGSIGGLQSTIGQHSLNLLRIDSKSTRKIVHPTPIQRGGYHFTSCGGIEMIREKIKSWGHQELNNGVVMKNLEKNIRSGQDIFQRETGTNLHRIDVNDRRHFDDRMSSIIQKYPHLVSTDTIQLIEPTRLRDFWRRTSTTWEKIKYKVRQQIKSGSSV